MISKQPLLNTRTKVVISVLAFCLIFGAMLAIVSVNGGALDLGVSKILVDLEPGAYLSDNVFGFFFEACGETVIYLTAAFCIAILMWYCEKVCKFHPWDYIGTVVFAVLTVVAFWFYFKTICGYAMTHLVGSGWSDYIGEAGYPYLITKADVYVLYMLEAAMAIVASVCLILATKNIKPDTLRKLSRWAILVAITVIITNVVVALVKGPVGRMRYRSMNVTGDEQFEGFTAWYVINGKRTGDDSLKYLADTHDMFRSFPSGHTSAAGTVYTLMFLPAVLGIKKKSVNALCWILPIVYVGLVAVSRIVVGAHYFSDVLFGGTIAFLSAMLVREIFVCKFSHFKCFKKGYVDLQPLDEVEVFE